MKPIFDNELFQKCVIMNNDYAHEGICEMSSVTLAGASFPYLHVTPRSPDHSYVRLPTRTLLVLASLDILYNYSFIHYHHQTLNVQSSRPQNETKYILLDSHAVSPFLKRFKRC